ncbi:CPBP family intramembrane glutamic endopeptidase [Dactylosporangium salmoneum]|uniref:Type II CAAX endopeptidase family protein n=1 Tax=Dactylosporangium salmoneum TaxID=53361 RepID=A0ABN3FGB9_9ACTN
MRLVWQLLAVAAVALVGSNAVNAVDGSPWLTLTIGLATAVLATFTYVWVVRRTEHRPPVEVSRRAAPGALTRGLLIGFAMCAAVIANIWFLGDYHVHGRGSVTGTLALLGFMAAAAVTEELIFRGILFRIIEEKIGTWFAMVLTGVLFGASHLLNKDATVWGAACIAVEAGFMLAAAYVATRNLWVGIGVHFAWNFALGGIFGLEVSGNGTSKGLVDATTSGGTLVSGGTFGPEASVYTLLGGVIITAAFMWLAGRRGHILPMRRRDAQVPANATLAK